MNIDFFINNSDDDTINKSLTAVTSLQGSLKEPCNIENPEITIENSGVLGANYCYISEFGRYYYINNQIILSNNRVKLGLTVDVLESFKTQILGLETIIENSTSQNDNYLSSDIWRANVKTKTDILNFPSGFNESGSFILITAGG